jgi:predicted short-subunit dehydrogenase-like oxidoreductase (DUF2520 family)
MSKPRRFSVGVIGAGRVGTALAAALAAAGHRVVAASGSSPASRKRIATLLPTARRLAPPDVARAADLVIVAVPDDSIGRVVIELAERDAFRPGQLILHPSGAHGLAILAPAAIAGADVVAIHPAMTFSGRPDDVLRLRGISYGVTAPTAVRPVADRLVSDLGGSAEWIAESARPLYHAGLAHGANHLVTLVNEAMDRLRDAGVLQPERVLSPLLHAALDNTLAHGDAALTGPIARGDAGTVAKHLATLADTAPESVPAYRALARRTADRAIASGRLAATDAAPLLGVLASPISTARRDEVSA